MAVEVRAEQGVSKVTGFYQDVVTEMRKVTWPDRPQLQDTTVKIIIFVLFLGAIIGIIDVAMQMILVKGIPSIFSGR